jgi:large subunit ribosomal protein L9
MDIILKENVENLGLKDDLVTVKDGYGRNFLIPQGKAVVATKSAIKVREENMRQRAHKIEKMKEEAQASLKKLQSAEIEVGAKAGEGGKIFGSVNTIQLADAIKKMGIEVDRKNIRIENEPIKSLGTYTAEVEIVRGVKGTVEFKVVEE